MQCGHILPVKFSIEIYGERGISYKANLLNCGARTHTRVPKCYWLSSDLGVAETRMAPRVTVTHGIMCCALLCHYLKSMKVAGITPKLYNTHSVLLKKGLCSVFVHFCMLIKAHWLQSFESKKKKMPVVCPLLKLKF